MNSRPVKFTDAHPKRQQMLSQMFWSYITIVNSCARRETDSLLLLESQPSLLMSTARTIAALNIWQHGCRTLLFVLTRMFRRLVLNFVEVCVRDRVPRTCT